MQGHEKAVIMDEKAMTRAVTRISFEVLERNKGAEDLCFIGILSRGIALAQRLAVRVSQQEGREVPAGCLDITPFRDDCRRRDGDTDLTDIPFSIKGKRVVLVDDVVYTGRSVRAAIDALMARGRPQSIQLAVLVDRGHRELPIRADYIGKNLPTSKDESVKVMVKEMDGCDKVIIYDGPEGGNGGNG